MTYFSGHLSKNSSSASVNSLVRLTSTAKLEFESVKVHEWICKVHSKLPNCSGALKTNIEVGIA